MSLLNECNHKPLINLMLLVQKDLMRIMLTYSLINLQESSVGTYSALNSPESTLSLLDFPEGQLASQVEGFCRPRTTGSLPEISQRLATKQAAKPPSSLVASPVRDTPRKNM